MPRETDVMKMPGTYEFPREFRKLRASPFLRGFYFSGVRPIQVQETAPAAAPQPQQPQSEPGGGATKMFRVGFQAEQKAAQAVAGGWGGTATRKVAQWLFLGHLFHDVILADHVSRAAS